MDTRLRCFHSDLVKLAIPARNIRVVGDFVEGAAIAYGPFYAVSESVVVNADLSTCVPGEDFHRGSLVDLHLRIAPDGAC